MKKTARFLFLGELRDFLQGEKKNDILYSFIGKPSIKDAVEALGVPHTEIDVLMANGESVTFSHCLKNGERIEVYPVSQQVRGPNNIVHLKQSPPGRPKFILDVHLGKLAKKLRLLGFDTIYSNTYTDREIVQRALDENRIILTRDRGLLKIKNVKYGYWIRSQDPNIQIDEISRRFNLFPQIKPFFRCMECNGIIRKIQKQKIIDRLQFKTKKYYNEFYHCEQCDNLYWKGTHYFKMINFIRRLKGADFE